MQRTLSPPTSPCRRGAAAIFTLVVIPVALAFAAITIDVGQLYKMASETQNTADAAALAGASTLTDGQVATYYDRAQSYLQRNQQGHRYTTHNDEVIELGVWDGDTQTFTVLPSQDDWGSANAVRVEAKQTAVPLFFASLFGRNDASLAREAVASVDPTCGGIWGLESIKVPGNVVTDSYSSSEGPYWPGTARSNGDVCSGGDLTVGGNAMVNGDAVAGPAGIVSVGGNAVVTGTTGSMDSPPPSPSLDFTEVMASNDNGLIGLSDNGTDPLVGNDFSLGTGDHLTLSPGSYYFETFETGNGTSITVTGPTTIYLAGDMGVNGDAVFNTTMEPSDFTIISSGAVVKINSQAVFYGSILAPNAQITLNGSAELFGAVLGREVTIAGSFQFHVDESLDIVHMLKPSPHLVR